MVITIQLMTLRKHQNFDRISFDQYSLSLINIVSSLVKIMAWHHIGAKPFSKPMMTLFPDACMHHKAWRCQ